MSTSSGPVEGDPYHHNEQSDWIASTFYFYITVQAQSGCHDLFAAETPHTFCNAFRLSKAETSIHQPVSRWGRGATRDEKRLVLFNSPHDFDSEGCVILPNRPRYLITVRGQGYCLYPEGQGRR